MMGLAIADSREEEGRPSPAPEKILKLYKGDSFKNGWNQRRQYFWDKRQSDHGAVVFLGDSITQGWASLPESFPSLKVAGRGISGDTAEGLIFRLKEDVLSLDPAAVVILIGTNDLDFKKTPTEIARNIGKLLEAVETHRKGTPVIVCKVMPRGNTKRDSIVALNELLEKMVVGRATVFLCDTYTPFVNAEGGASSAFFSDRLHPNEDGYRKWAEVLVPVMERAKVWGGRR